MIKMDPEKKRVWLEALRSGKYQQDRYFLKTKKGMCCLGVYADAVEHVEWSEGLSKREGDFVFKFDLKSLSHEADLPAAWIDANTRRYLSVMNDTYKNNFNEIADWIEENL